MRSSLIGLLVILAVSAAQAAKVTMFTDNTYTTKVKRQKLDCSIHKNKTKALTLGFKMSVAFVAKAGPEVSFGKQTSINWNAMSQKLILRYEELCDHHNKGLLTVADFDKKYAKLEEYFDKAVDLKEDITDTLAYREDKLFKEMDAEAEKIRAEESQTAVIKERVTKLSDEVNELAKEVELLDAPASEPEKSQND